MPTRLLREGILTSDRVNLLDAAEEVFYRRLMSKVDDHGLYDARPSILRASLYPLKLDRVREADISRWIAACVKAGLIVLYEADGKQLLCLLNTSWDKRSKPKYPLPPENICKQVLTVPSKSTVVVVVDEDDMSSGSPPQFPRFWDAWPTSPRKASKRKCGDVWRRKNLDPLVDKIVAHVEAMKSSDQWRDEKYIPAPLTYLNQERWDGADVSTQPKEKRVAV